MNADMEKNKIRFYLDFLGLHREAKKDGIIERNRKMLRDDCADDNRTGYMPTIHRLLIDCIYHYFSVEEYEIVKTQNILTYTIKPKETKGNLVRALLYRDLCRFQYPLTDIVRTFNTTYDGGAGIYLTLQIDIAHKPCIVINAQKGIFPESLKAYNAMKKFMETITIMNNEMLQIERASIGSLTKLIQKLQKDITIVPEGTVPKTIYIQPDVKPTPIFVEAEKPKATFEELVAKKIELYKEDIKMREMDDTTMKKWAEITVRKEMAKGV